MSSCINSYKSKGSRIITHKAHYKKIPYLLCILGGGTGTQSSEESPDSSEDDLYFGGTGFNSGERQSEQNRVSQHGQTVKSPITTLLGHSGVVISCGM